jgi:Leu/Phe-tRNA-protein transferase
LEAEAPLRRASIRGGIAIFRPMRSMASKSIYIINFNHRVSGRFKECAKDARDWITTYNEYICIYIYTHTYIQEHGGEWVEIGLVGKGR